MCVMCPRNESSVVGGKVKLFFKGDTMEIAQFKLLQLPFQLNPRKCFFFLFFFFLIHSLDFLNTPICQAPMQEVKRWIEHGPCPERSQLSRGRGIWNNYSNEIAAVVRSAMGTLEQEVLNSGREGSRRREEYWETLHRAGISWAKSKMIKAISRQKALGQRKWWGSRTEHGAFRSGWGKRLKQQAPAPTGLALCCITHLF